MRRTLTLLLFASLLLMPAALLRVPSDLGLRLGLWIDAVAGRENVLGLDARRRVERALRHDEAITDEVLRRWQETANAALASPLPVELPYAETLVIGRDGETAVGLELALPPGLELLVTTEAHESATGGLLVDLLSADGIEPIASMGPGALSRRLRPDVLTDGHAPLRLRVQAIPGSRGRFAFRLDARHPLDFPVVTDAKDAVRSVFGMPRDGGRREHHGIDIFAPRGTPVLAAADGIVVRTGDSTRGGLHVWQRAARSDGEPLGALYYAHLDRLDVEAGMRVRRGDRLGTVGNTGNARTTPPHLHFGLYRRFTGPIDPLPLTGTRRALPPTLTLRDAPPGWLVVRSARAKLRAGPGTDSAILDTLEGGELVDVEANAGDGGWLRVRSGGAVHGFIARSLLASPDAIEARPAELGAPQALLSAPRPDAPELRSLSDDALPTLQVSGRFGDAFKVSTPDGLDGWILPDRGALE